MVMWKTASPRSYLVQTPSRQLRRNRRQLHYIPEQADIPETRDVVRGAQEPAVNPKPTASELSV